MSTHKLLAGVSLAALGAAGLTILSTPAFATGVVGWYLVPPGGSGSGPAYACEGPQCPANPAGVVASTAPEYAEQAIISRSSALTIPGYGSGSVYGGFTWVDGAVGAAGGTVLLTFTMPAGEIIKSIGSTNCPGTVLNTGGTSQVGGVDGAVFTKVQNLSCSKTQLQAAITVSAAGGPAWYQLPAFQLNINAALIAALGSPTANGGSVATLGGNCETITLSNGAGCEITATSSQLSSVTGGGSAVLATSQNVLSLRTFNNSQLICIDVLEDQQPGTRFQQPCDSLHDGSNSSGPNSLYAAGDSNGQFATNSSNQTLAVAPTKVDGNVNGAPEVGTIHDPLCTTTDINVTYGAGNSAECGNGSVTGAITSERDVLVADKGTIEINVTELLSLDGIHIFQWKGGSVQFPTITIVGLCAGLMGPIENIGSVPCAGGIKPFTGETTDSLGNVGYVGLTPLHFTLSSGQTQLTGLAGFNNPSPNLTGVSAFCPKEDDIVGNLNLGSPSNGSTVTFSGGRLMLQDVPNNTVLTTQAFTSLPSYYEFCDYANGTSVLGPVAQWFVTVSVDAGQADATVLTDNPKGISSIGGASAIIANPGQPADALLVFEYNGIGQLFQFTNGATNYSAYLRVVNLMEDYVSCPAGSIQSPGSTTSPCGSETGSPATSGPGSPGCVTVDPNATCEPAGQVVCKVWGDDGQNAFVTLWNTQQTGLISGTNAMYPVASLFTQAGITASNANPFDLGSLLCFHNQRIHLTQFWIEPNGTIVNVQ